MRQEFSKAVRRDAFLRAGGCCEAVDDAGNQCGRKLGYGEAEYHHVTEYFIGGESVLSNCLVACKKCHARITQARRPAIDKTRRIEEKRMNLRPKKQGFRGWRKFNGEAVWR